MSVINQIHVGPGGTFEPKGDYSTAPSDIDNLFEHLSQSEDNAIAIHFHGGLVSESSGVATANMMEEVYESADNYPISFVWETGLVETFRDNLKTIYRLKLFQKILKWLLKRVGEKFGGFNSRGAGAPIPMAEIEAELAKDEPFADYDSEDTGEGAARGGAIGVTEDDLDSLLEELEAEFKRDVDVDLEIEDLLSEKESIKPTDSSDRGIFSSLKFAKKLARIAYRIIRRHVRKRDHGFYPTVIEEILREFYLADLGAWVWANMKNKAEYMWNPNSALVGEEQHVGSYVLAHLENLQQTKPGLKINLIGHSTGAVVICHLLRVIDERDINVKVSKVCFLASAARCDLVNAELVDHPERFEELCYYTMADEYERKDVLVPVAYTRSLLYFISGVLEPDEVDVPISGMMRYASKVKPFDEGPARKWADFICANEMTILSDTSELDPPPGPGRRSTARKHGNFDNDKSTQESLTHVLSN